MSSKNIDQCIPWLREKYELLALIAFNNNIKIALTCTSRIYLEQYALYLQGRESLDKVNHARENASLYKITEEQNKKVTWTLDSKHIINDKRKLSEAFDIVIVKDGKLTWDLKVDVNNNDIPDYIDLAIFGNKIGLICGDYFKDKEGKPKPDYCHFEAPENHESIS
jgi:hypothetical protein